MDSKASELQEKIRQQFDTVPYPRRPLEESSKGDCNTLFLHNLGTPYYLRYQKAIGTEGKVILDAGCGTGYKSLALAEANPGAKVVGIDLSEESVKIARYRLQYHGFESAEFYPLSIEDLPCLGFQFDYINADEVLYLLPDPVRGLQAMKSVLKPEGIIRTNFHCSLSRFYYFIGQEVFKLMGLMDGNPQELEISLVRETMRALKDGVLLKSRTWLPGCETSDELILANFLLQGDKGHTIPEMFAALQAADLEFISMVNWRSWDLTDLFKDPDELPVFLGLALPGLSVEQQLHLFEMLHPIHTLLDFWCGHPGRAQSFVPVEEWANSDWLGARAHLHPQLRVESVREDLLECVANRRPWEISHYITAPTKAPIFVESHMAASLLPLWEEAQPVSALVERWLKIRPLNPGTLEPVSQQKAFEEVKGLLSDLETFLYVLLQRSA
jgi:SAM-dependent methyltransferase